MNAPSRILIVEDEAPFSDVIAAALTSAGYRVQVVGDGQRAESLLAAESFDLVITDVIMPERDGIELIMNLRAEKKRVPVIAMTGVHTFTELYLKTASALGAHRVLTKPFTVAHLLETVQDALADRHPV